MGGSEWGSKTHARVCDADTDPQRVAIAAQSAASIGLLIPEPVSNPITLRDRESEREPHPPHRHPPDKSPSSADPVGSGESAVGFLIP